MDNGTYEAPPQKSGNRDGCRRSHDNPKRARQVKALWKADGASKPLKKWARDNSKNPVVSSWMKEKKVHV